MLHVSEHDEDEQGWPTLACSCGITWGPLPDVETVADVGGDHMYEVGVRDGRTSDNADYDGRDTKRLLEITRGDR